MKLLTVCTLLGLAWSAVAADTPGRLEPLESSAGYLAAAGAPSGGQTLFAPWHVWASEAEDVLQNVTTESQEECAALCWQVGGVAWITMRCSPQPPWWAAAVARLNPVQRSGLLDLQDANCSLFDFRVCDNEVRLAVLLPWPLLHRRLPLHCSFCSAAHAGNSTH